LVFSSEPTRQHPIIPEWKLITNYWMIERPALASKTRETIDADFTGMFDPLTRGKIGELFGTTTNLTPDDIFNGKVVVINIPVARYREVGQFAALIWAQLFQCAVDRRTYTAPETRPVFLWEDEAHYFTIEQDASFQTTARSKGISVVRLTQNIPNLLDAYGRDGKHKVDTLLVITLRRSFTETEIRPLTNGLQRLSPRKPLINIQYQPAARFIPRSD
jgi:hypothetical protein